MLNKLVNPFSTTISTIDFCICVFFLLVISALVIYKCRKYFSFIIAVCLLDISFLLLYLDFTKSALLLFLLFVIYTITISFMNFSNIRKAFSRNKLKIHGAQKKKTENVEEDLEFYRMVIDTALMLSRKKCGALMTFERENKMDEYISNGVVLNAPFNKEIVDTIFYHGTRLHDGAILIRGHTILAASIYYQPSTKPLSRVCGARHRAALGISEVTDSITIVVSEETGRIEIAKGGKLYPVSSKYEEFEREFLDAMKITIKSSN